MSVDCRICFNAFDPAEPFVEGHKVGGILHGFDPGCIRQWLAISSHCPICAADLQLIDLIQYSNQNYLWYMHAIKLIQSQTIWGAKKILPIAVSMGAVIAIAKAVPYASILIPYYLNGFFNGTKVILISGIGSAAPMILNKVRGFRSTENINKISVLAVSLAAAQVCYTSVEDLSTLMGIIAGSSLTASIISVLGENVREEGGFQFGLFPNDFTTSQYVLGQINLGAAFLVGVIAAGKLGNYYTNDRGLFIQGFSSVIGGILGICFTYVTAGLIHFPLVFFRPFLRLTR